MGAGSASGRGAFAYSLGLRRYFYNGRIRQKDYSIDNWMKKLFPVVEEITGDKNVQTQKVCRRQSGYH